MKISRVSPLTRKESTMELDVTEEQMRVFYSPGRPLIQNIFPQLNQAEREFILSGYT